MVPPKTSGSAEDSIRTHVHIPGFSDAENNNLIRGVTELAATAAAIAARDARGPRRISHQPSNMGTGTSAARPAPLRSSTFPDVEDATEHAQAVHGGHDAPNWSRTKSSVILMGATVLYAIVAEILVDTVDVVLDNYAIDPKFLGITLFALVPNTTEFLVCPLDEPRLVILTNRLCATERHFLCHERKHCLVHGNRICIRSSGLPSSNPCFGPILGSVSHSTHRGQARSHSLDFQPALSTVGYGDCNSLRVSFELHVW
jgi:hypothetical protein